MTMRSASGAADRDVEVLARQQRLAEEERRELATSDVTPTTTVNTESLAQSTGSRFGTAVSDERIMPVAYSPVMSSTPSTPTAS